MLQSATAEVWVKFLLALVGLGLAFAAALFSTISRDAGNLWATLILASTSLVMAIVTLAHNLRLKVIAEGIETEDQFKFLRLLRCDEGQGYLFGKPAPADPIEATRHARYLPEDRYVMSYSLPPT